MHERRNVYTDAHSPDTIPVDLELSNKRRRAALEAPLELPGLDGILNSRNLALLALGPQDCGRDGRTAMARSHFPVVLVWLDLLPLRKLPVDIADALRKPGEGAERHPLVHLVDLLVCELGPLGASLRAERDLADQERARTLACVLRDADRDPL